MLDTFLIHLKLSHSHIFLTQHESDTKHKTLNYTFEKRRKGENKNFAFSLIRTNIPNGN